GLYRAEVRIPARVAVHLLVIAVADSRSKLQSSGGAEDAVREDRVVAVGDRIRTVQKVEIHATEIDAGVDARSGVDVERSDGDVGEVSETGIEAELLAQLIVDQPLEQQRDRKRGAVLRADDSGVVLAVRGDRLNLQPIADVPGGGDG